MPVLHGVVTHPYDNVFKSVSKNRFLMFLFGWMSFFCGFVLCLYWVIIICLVLCGCVCLVLLLFCCCFCYLFVLFLFCLFVCLFVLFLFCLFSFLRIVSITMNSKTFKLCRGDLLYYRQTSRGLAVFPHLASRKCVLYLRNENNWITAQFHWGRMIIRHPIIYMTNICS